MGHSDDGSIQPGDIWTFTNRVSVEAGERNGRTFVIQERMKTHIEAAGFKDVTEHKYKWPIGGWSQNKRLKEIGKWNLYHWEEGLEGWTMALMTRVLGVSTHLASTSRIIKQECILSRDVLLTAR